MRAEQGSWFNRLVGRLRWQKPNEAERVQVPSGKHDEQRPSPASGRPREKEVMGMGAKGQVILDDFVLERLLGEGGMGAVYLVCSRSTGQRFAVKRVRFREAADQRNFLAELQTWIDLPAHPHLTACRFFRTVGEEILVFAEFVEGGSLAEWIRDRRLISLGQILDIAIQFAWGLHAVHALGLVHQDVKPGNVLMTADGVAKVSDFGLARARAKAGEGTVSDSLRIREGDQESPGSFLVSYVGMTPAYCSPEQARGKSLSHRTDIWSWGVSLLEIFSGEVTWKSGVVAAEVLENYLDTVPGDAGLPTMPASMAAVLRRCFRHDPAERWGSLGEVAEVVRQIYRQEVGQEYPRPVPQAPHRGDRAAIAHDRRTTTRVQWTDPREWLVRALEAAGRDVAEAEVLLSPREGSRKAQAIADLAAYEEARRIFEGLVAQGRKELEPQLATLCIEKAFVHASAEDLPGAVAFYDRAIEIRERLVNVEGRRELQGNLAWVKTGRAAALLALGDVNRARREAQESLAILKAEIARTERADLQAVLNWATHALKDVL